jgi:hypothetical protein
MPNPSHSTSLGATEPGERILIQIKVKKVRKQAQQVQRKHYEKEHSQQNGVKNALKCFANLTGRKLQLR